MYEKGASFFMVFSGVSHLIYVVVASCVGELLKAAERRTEERRRREVEQCDYRDVNPCLEQVAPVAQKAKRFEADDTLLRFLTSL
jgi:hypothetical protein